MSKSRWEIVSVDKDGSGAVIAHPDWGSVTVQVERPHPFALHLAEKMIDALNRHRPESD